MTPEVDALLETKQSEIKDKIAVDFLRKIELCLSKDGLVFPELKRWLKDIPRILGSYLKEQPVFIAVKGMTGAGKTTAINTMIGHKILPTAGSGRAVTAVLTSIRYNDKYTEPFACEVRFCSSGEIRRVILALQKEYKESNDIDVTTPEAIKFALTFPNIRLEHLHEMPVDQLLKSAKSRWPIDGVQIEKHNDAGDFSKAIAKYISSDNAGKELWHIIEKVTVYVVSGLLRDGLILVDFPGAGDANAARGSGTKINLDSVVIFSAFTRGVDDKVGSDLLSKYSTLFEKLSGKQKGYERCGIIYALTRWDEFLKDIDEYLDSQPKEAQRLRRQNHELKCLKDQVSKQIEELTKDIALETNRSSTFRSDKDDQLNKLKTFCQRNQLPSPRLLKGRVVGVSSAADFPESKSQCWTELVFSLEKTTKLYRDSQRQKKKLDYQLRRAQKKNARLANEVKAILIQNGIKAAIDDLHEETARKAIKFDKEIAKNYQGRSDSINEIKLRKNSPSFYAIGISSHAYRVLRNEAGKDEAVSGFRNVADSGIPALKSMLRLVAAKKKQDRAHAFSRGVEILENELGEWTRNQAFDVPISVEEREVMILRSDELFQEYFRKIESIVALKVSSIKTFAKKHLEPGLYKVAKDMSKSLKSDFQQHEKINFSSYKAICIRGGVFKSRDKSFDWITPAQLKFLSCAESCWTQFFDKIFLYQLHDIVDDIIEKLAEFGEARSKIAEECCPALTGRATNLKAQLPQMRNRLDSLVGAVKSNTVELCTKALSAADTGIKEIIDEACAQALDVEKGPGAGLRMKMEIKLYLQNQAPKNFSDIAQRMVDIVQKTMSNLDTVLHVVIDPAISEIPIEFEETLKIARQANAKGAKEEISALIQEFNGKLDEEVLQLRHDTQINDPELQAASFCLEDFNKEEDSESEEEE